MKYSILYQKVGVVRPQRQWLNDSKSLNDRRKKKRKILKKCIACCPTEWSNKLYENNKLNILKKYWNFKQSEIDYIIQRLQRFEFWETVAASGNLPQNGEDLRFFHPIEFVDHMSKLKFGRMDKVPWLKFAFEEKEKGIVENPDLLKHNQQILNYHRASTINIFTTDEAAWCSSFINWCMKKSGYIGTNSAKSLSWRNWKNGKLILKNMNSQNYGAIYGSIALFDYHDDTGHVTFVVGKRGKKLLVLGGNQGDPGKVQISSYRLKTIKNNLVGFVVPNDYVIDKYSYEIPEIKGNYKDLTYKETR